VQCQLLCGLSAVSTYSHRPPVPAAGDLLIKLLIHASSVLLLSLGIVVLLCRGHVPACGSKSGTGADSHKRPLLPSTRTPTCNPCQVACFLTRGDLYQSWEVGARVFDKYLIDADWALNNANWMWLSCSSFFYQYFR
jgi:hypothetical protein